METIRINSYIPMTNVEGPGTRFCIWTQGCTIKCKGCANKHMWDVNGGIEISTSDLCNKILEYKKHIEGITFLGGEPLLQIAAVTDICKTVKNHGLTVVIFTGYTYPQIENEVSIKELIKYVDILIDGKYEQELQDFSRPWVGSKNQNYYFLSNNYDLSTLSNYKNKIEIRINNTEEIMLNGMGDFNSVLKKL